MAYRRIYNSRENFVNNTIVRFRRLMIIRETRIVDSNNVIEGERKG